MGQSPNGNGLKISKFISLSELIAPPCMYIHSWKHVMV